MKERDCLKIVWSYFLSTKSTLQYQCLYGSLCSTGRIMEFHGDFSYTFLVVVVNKKITSELFSLSQVTFYGTWMWDFSLGICCMSIGLLTLFMNARILTVSIFGLVFQGRNSLNCMGTRSWKHALPVGLSKIWSLSVAHVVQILSEASLDSSPFSFSCGEDNMLL